MVVHLPTCSHLIETTNVCAVKHDQHHRDRSCLTGHTLVVLASTQIIIHVYLITVHADIIIKMQFDDA